MFHITHCRKPRGFCAFPAWSLLVSKPRFGWTPLLAACSKGALFCWRWFGAVRQKKTPKSAPQKNTLPETNSSHLKIGHPKRKRSYSSHPFSGAMLVSGKVFVLNVYRGMKYYPFIFRRCWLLFSLLVIVFFLVGGVVKGKICGRGGEMPFFLEWRKWKKS